MPFNVLDSTANTQRLSVSNSGAVEIGFTTAIDGLTVNGNQILSGPSLAQNTIPPAGLNRITGVVTLTSKAASTVTVGPVAGFGTVDGAVIIRFDGDSFDAALMTTADGATKFCAYSVI
jgi:hypothetical protein